MLSRLLVTLALALGALVATPAAASAIWDSPPLYSCSYSNGGAQASIGVTCAWQTNPYANYRVKATCTAHSTGQKWYLTGPWRTGGAWSMVYCPAGTVTSKSWQKIVLW